MELGIKKCTMLIIKKGKGETTKEIEQTNQKSSKTLEKKKKIIST